MKAFERIESLTDTVVASFTCGMAVLAMTAHGQDARATPVALFQRLAE
jgi:hypothetical protein